MKNFALGSLLLFVVAQSAGCIITDDGGGDDGGGEPARVSATWAFKTLLPAGTLDCPATFNTVALYNQEIDLQNKPVGNAIVDLFRCNEFRGTSAPLPPSVYQSWIEVTTGSGGMVFATSPKVVVDIIDVDKTLSANIYDDAGYFVVDWNLQRAADNAPLSCNDDPELDGIAIDSTLIGPNSLKVDKFRCEDRYGITAALLEGDYGVTLSAFRDSDGKAIGPLTTLSTKTIFSPNKVTDLGSVIVKIDQ